MGYLKTIEGMRMQVIGRYSTMTVYNKYAKASIAPRSVRLWRIANKGHVGLHAKALAMPPYTEIT